jgi:hypothetical protein
VHDNTTEIGCFDPARRLAWMLEDAMRLEPAFQRAEARHSELDDALRSGIRVRSIAAVMARDDQP